MTMRHFALLAFSLFILAHVRSQTNPYEFGVETGPSAIFLRGNFFPSGVYGARIGYASGISFQYNRNSHVSFRTGIHFQRKGAQLKLPFTDANGNEIQGSRTRSNFDYLTMSFLTRISFGKQRRIFLNAGPYTGYLIQQTDITTSSGSKFRVSHNHTRTYDRIDLGIASGFGATLPIRESLVMSVEVRNNLGLINLVAPSTDDGTLRTNSTVLLLGLAYRFGYKAIGMGSEE